MTPRPLGLSLPSRFISYSMAAHLGRSGLHWTTHVLKLSSQSCCLHRCISVPSSRLISYSSSSHFLHPSPPHPTPSKPLLSFDVHTNPYKARHQWPPDISKLSEKQQFRLERKYRRRAKLRYARPGWTKATKLMQSFMVVGVIIYAVFFMELEGQGENPFHGVREWVKGLFGDAFTKTQRRRTSDEAIDAEPHR